MLRNLSSEMMEVIPKKLMSFINARSQARFLLMKVLDSHHGNNFITLFLRLSSCRIMIDVFMR